MFALRNKYLLLPFLLARPFLFLIAFSCTVHIGETKVCQPGNNQNHVLILLSMHISSTDMNIEAKD